MKEKAVQLLRRIAEKGYVMERELKEDERELVDILLREGVLERCYTIAPEYRADIVKLCRPRVITVRHADSRMKNLALRFMIPVALSALPFYLFIKSLLLGCMSVALFFLVISGACAYGGVLISRRFIEKYKFLRLR